MNAMTAQYWVAPNHAAMATIERKTGLSGTAISAIGMILGATALAGKLFGTIRNRNATALLLSGASMAYGGQSERIAFFAVPSIGMAGTVLATKGKEIVNGLRPHFYLNIDLMGLLRGQRWNAVHVGVGSFFDLRRLLS